MHCAHNLLFSICKYTNIYYLIESQFGYSDALEGLFTFWIKQIKKYFSVNKDYSFKSYLRLISKYKMMECIFL